MTKFSTEKVLHEIIRDLPDAARAERNYNKGLITFDEAILLIATAYRKEMNKSET